MAASSASDMQSLGNGFSHAVVGTMSASRCSKSMRSWSSYSNAVASSGGCKQRADWKEVQAGQRVFCISRPHRQSHATAGPTPLHGGAAVPQPRRGAPSWLLTQNQEAVPPVQQPSSLLLAQQHHSRLQQVLEPGQHPAVQRLAGHPAVTVPKNEGDQQQAAQQCALCMCSE